MDINLLQKISLATAVFPVVAFVVFLTFCKIFPKSKNCGVGSGGVILPVALLFTVAIGLLLLTSTYEFLFSNKTQGANGIGLSIVTIVIVYLSFALLAYLEQKQKSYLRDKYISTMESNHLEQPQALV